MSQRSFATTLLTLLAGAAAGAALMTGTDARMHRATSTTVLAAQAPDPTSHVMSLEATLDPSVPPARPAMARLPAQGDASHQTASTPANWRTNGNTAASAQHGPSPPTNADCCSLASSGAISRRTASSR